MFYTLVPHRVGIQWLCFLFVKFNVEIKFVILMDTYIS
jgi:hypothetical protein